MEIAGLILRYIQTLAWPAVVLAGLLLFRRDIATILARLKQIGLPGDLSLSFEEAVREVKSSSSTIAEQALAAPQQSSSPTIPITEANARLLSLDMQPSPSGLDFTRYIDMARQDPNVALAGLRIELEIMARNVLKGFQIASTPRDSYASMLRKLLDHSAITPDQHLLALNILRACNAAVHGTRVSFEDANDIISASNTLTEDYLSWLSWGFGDGWRSRTALQKKDLHAESRS